MSELYEPYEKLFTLVVLGRSFEVPENNILLRQLQFVCSEIGYGKYCWNAECRYCEVQYRIGDGPELPGLACRLKGLPGMRQHERRWHRPPRPPESVTADRGQTANGLVIPSEGRRPRSSARRIW
jgi:hypothetical protein